MKRDTKNGNMESTSIKFIGEKMNLPADILSGTFAQNLRTYSMVNTTTKKISKAIKMSPCLSMLGTVSKQKAIVEAMIQPMIKKTVQNAARDDSGSSNNW